MRLAVPHTTLSLSSMNLIPRASSGSLCKYTQMVLTCYTLTLYKIVTQHTGWLKMVLYCWTDRFNLSFSLKTPYLIFNCTAFITRMLFLIRDGVGIIPQALYRNESYVFWLEEHHHNPYEPLDHHVIYEDVTLVNFPVTLTLSFTRSPSFPHNPETMSLMICGFMSPPTFEFRLHRASDAPEVITWKDEVKTNCKLRSRSREVVTPPWPALPWV